jgi:hypothetical protein
MEKNIYWIDNNFLDDKCNCIVIKVIRLMFLFKQIICVGIYFLIAIISSLILI